MATDLQVTCINKRNGDHLDSHERISHIGGAGWRHTEDAAIANIEAKTHNYTVSKDSKKVKVVVATHNKRKYLKTENDGYAPDNLLSLPECN